MSYNDYHDYIKHSDDDELMHFEKGQRAKNHKYIKIHISKNGKPWYEYADSYYKTVKSALNDFGKKTGKAVNLIGRSAKDAYKSVSKKAGEAYNKASKAVVSGSKAAIKKAADASGYTAKKNLENASRSSNRVLKNKLKKEYDNSLMGKTEKAVKDVSKKLKKSTANIAKTAKEKGKQFISGVDDAIGISDKKELNRLNSLGRSSNRALNNRIRKDKKATQKDYDDSLLGRGEKALGSLSKKASNLTKKGKNIVKDILTKDHPNETRMKSTKKWADNLGKNIKKGAGNLADDAADIITDKQRQSAVSKTLSNIGLSKSQIKGVNDLLDKGDLTIDTIKKKLGLRTGDAEKVKKSILSIFNK